MKNIVSLSLNMSEIMKDMFISSCATFYPVSDSQCDINDILLIEYKKLLAMETCTTTVN